MMAHRLALETGAGWDVDAMMREMGGRQLVDWIAYLELQEEAMKRSKGETGKLTNWRDQKAALIALAQSREAAEA